MKRSLIALAALAASGCAMVSSRRDYEDQARGHELRALNAGGLDATLFAKKATAPAFMPVDGRAIVLQDSITLSVNPTAGDVINLVRIPAGTEVHHVKILPDDLDTNGSPTIVYRAGYAPCDSTSALTAVDTYFAAAGQTGAQSGTAKACDFKPKKFEEDVYLTVTINTASATFAAGDIFGTVIGAAIGPK